ncbi:putative carbonic anhydrase 5 [Venturia canescens]|uniref:putative carbonic anhydrase 5 n=1 Tax=Venturia canescens TaxID=32260 RepID=UPI001C9C3AC9|nr:putative carbonic anhydrase 5 [Venturia canescens]
MSDVNEDEDEDEGDGSEGEDEGEHQDEDNTEIPWSTQFMESEIFPSPIDLNIGRMTQKELTPLIWCHYDKFPAKLKITNTGKTVVLSAKWHGDGPFITGGPFLSKQIFSQLHLHWGPNDMDGSEHSVDGQRSKVPK